VTADSRQVIPGWYGKLPSLGDFASRRLEGEFIPTWDAWLQVVLQATRGSFGESWLDSYLTMPIWRFVLLPGLVGPNGWAGVLMPSVDRVGRHFPLTLVVPLSSYAAAAHAVFRGADWFGRLEEAALGALDPMRGLDEFDLSVVDRAFTVPQSADLEDSNAAAPRRLPSAEEGFESMTQAEALRAWGRYAGWNGLWWTRGRMDGDPLMLTCGGLPTSQEFGWLLQSSLSPAGRLDAAANADA
jgi:type VI secretion system protein ImpM